ncbi:MAG TPA: hypothetical protein VMU30_10885 [Bacteroidota bacterium]|nr:hypothetical protein [Bacteroidota bacterium]
MQRKSFIFIVMIFAWHVGGYAGQGQSITQNILEETHRHPKLTIQDIYKFAYQAAMGNEHLMTDTVTVRSYLQEEWNEIDSSYNEPLVEYLSSDSSIARINLRPYKQRGGSMEQLVAAMLQTAKSIRPSFSLLKKFLADIVALADQFLIPFKAEEVRNYFQEMEAKHYPAVHHSNEYETLYHPAYRVIAGSLVHELE